MKEPKVAVAPADPDKRITRLRTLHEPDRLPVLDRRHASTPPATFALAMRVTQALWRDPGRATSLATTVRAQGAK